MKSYLRILAFFTFAVVAGQCVAMNLVEKYADLKAGDWVRLDLTNKTRQLLFVAAKDEKTVTIEVEEKDRGFVVSLRQLVIDVKEKRTILVRDKDPVSGEVKEHLPNEEENIDEVLQTEFRFIADEKLTHKIEELDEKKLEYVSKTKTFNCKYYKSTIDNRFVEMWYSDEIPLYPLKANIPGLQTTIRLVRFGTGMKSKFQPANDSKEDK